ncbi:DUF7847 domain-containing protein [Streptomyces mauvecolor]
MPPPPKPGVIPLRPLTLGDILGGAFSALGRHWKQLFGVALVAYGIAALVVGGTVAIAVAAVHDHLDPVFDQPYGEDPIRADVQPVVIAGIVVFLVSMAMWLVAMALVYAAVPAVLQDAVLGRRTTFGPIWRKAWSRFPAVLGALALQWLAMMSALIVFLTLMLVTIVTTSRHDDGPVALMIVFMVVFLALIPVSIWLWVRFAFAPAAAVLENQRPVEALRRSARLVKDAWWRTFGILLLIGMISGMIGYFIQLPFTYGGIFAAMPLALASGDAVGPKIMAVVVIVVLYLIGTVISQFLSTTLPQLATGLLYIDQRIRREDLAPALADAAGVPAAPAPPTGTW